MHRVGEASVRTSVLGYLALLLAAMMAGPAVAAEDPDWPCVQRLVPAIAAGMIWAGPPVDAVADEPSPALGEIAGELAARRVPLDDATAQVAAFAETLAADQRRTQLTLLFARTLELINRDRASIIQGVKN
jgi:hypothetical protein